MYCPPNIIWVVESRRIRWAGYVECVRDWRCASGFWWRDLREGDHLEDLGISCEDNIKMDLQVLGWGGMDSIGLVQDRERWQVLLNVLMNFQIP